MATARSAKAVTYPQVQFQDRHVITDAGLLLRREMKISHYNKRRNAYWLCYPLLLSRFSVWRYASCGVRIRALSGASRTRSDGTHNHVRRGEENRQGGRRHAAGGRAGRHTDTLLSKSLEMSGLQSNT